MFASALTEQDKKESERDRVKSIRRSEKGTSARERENKGADLPGEAQWEGVGDQLVIDSPSYYCAGPPGRESNSLNENKEDAG